MKDRERQAERQGRHREVASGGSRKRNPRADEQKRRRRLPSRGEVAYEAKPKIQGPEVDDAACGEGSRSYLGRPPAPSGREGNRSERRSATAAGGREESAEAVVPGAKPAAGAQPPYDAGSIYSGKGRTSKSKETSSGTSRPPKNPKRGRRHSAASRQLSLGVNSEHLMEEIVSRANIARAWSQVKANRGAPGIDGVTIEAFAEAMHERWSAVETALLGGRYAPSPVRKATIPKRDGSERVLGIPTVLDRVIQQAVLQVLTPLFDPRFSDSSFGYRLHRSAQGAVRKVKQHVKAGYGIAVDIDLEKFFDRVQHDVLMARVARQVKDRRVLQLIGRFLRAGLMLGGVVEPRTQGTPQGGPLSPLLSNILLDDFDQELERRGLPFARYADDIMVLVRSLAAGRRVMKSLTEWLGRELKLTVNPKKSKVAPIGRCRFLSFTFRGGHVVLAEGVLEEMKHRVRELTRRNRGISFERRLRELNAYLRGWMGYFGLSETKRIWTPIDGWIRRRLRACLWKQWKKKRTRVRNLLALGAPRGFALATGSSSKGPWVLSKTLATHDALSNEWFDAQGLVRLRYHWGSLAPLRRTA